MTLDELIDRLCAVREEMLRMERRHAPGGAAGARRAASMRNLLHYVAFRRQDLRAVHDPLASLGLSSLGRAEPRALDNVQGVLGHLHRLAGRADSGAPRDPPLSLAEGKAILEANTQALLGDAPHGRDVRIMVTMPADAATDPAVAADLLRAGMDLARINCAHDGAAAWAGMIRHVRDAEQATGRRCRIMMDLGGPKLRTGPLAEPLVLRPGDEVLLTLAQEPGRAGRRDDSGAALAPARVAITLPEAAREAKAGHRLLLDDGKIEGVVVALRPEGLLARITRSKAGGAKLRADKGVNLPDTPINLPALTDQDRLDLDFVCAHADGVQYSFVKDAADVAALQEELRRRGRPDLGVVLKIETRRAFGNLPALLLQAMQSPNCGVMIARGDLAVECGYERLAEVQEEILWFCEAAHVPVVWATQVLERLAKKGLPSRAEVTDAAMSQRAECVMLNKGPYITLAVRTLDDILRRMEGHTYKKTSVLRPLGLAAGFGLVDAARE